MVEDASLVADVLQHLNATEERKRKTLKLFCTGKGTMDFSSLTIKSHNSPSGYCSSLKKTSFLKVPEGGFSLSRNFHVCTHVNNIEVMYDRLPVNVKVERGSTFAFTRGLPYNIASILFTHVKITQQWKSNFTSKLTENRSR